MSVIILLFLLCTPFLSKRYSEKGRYYSWLIITVGFILPFRPQWINALINVDVLTGIQAPVGLPANTLLVSTDSVATVSIPTFSLWQIVFMVWLTGFVLFLCFHSIKYYHFAKVVQRWSTSVTDGYIFTIRQQLQNEMGIKKQIPVYLCTSVSSPMMIGLINARILLPKDKYTEDELICILKHELMHHKRKDLLYKHLVLAATAMHWFNPAVYLMARHIHDLCETSCDAEILKNADIETRRSYCETIFDMVQNQSELKTVLSTCFFGNKNNVKKRIISIMDTQRKKTGIIVFCVILAAILGTGCIITSEHAVVNDQPDIIQINNDQPDIDSTPDIDNLLNEAPDSTEPHENETDYLSQDEVEKINKSVEEFLKTMGVDRSILTGNRKININNELISFINISLNDVMVIHTDDVVIESDGSMSGTIQIIVKYEDE